MADRDKIKEINGQQNIDIAVLKTEVREIKENHLVHLSNDVRDLREKMIVGFEKQTEIINNVSLSLSTKLAYYAGALGVLIALSRFLASFVDK
mgnify:CR=1 FL=1